ncbi:hypothetical protein O181_046214 [Austropuccinia psidii MF-1]|uniref:Uncharacterized protein n=1 Tax=Austropuccinia psidii MF-1 TaxID=1389203 RepID=A0A9Q3HL17_9BASI|nr:hypothetical protein [Austropuccinia psidii MF-1]
MKFFQSAKTLFNRSHSDESIHCCGRPEDLSHEARLDAMVAEIENLGISSSTKKTAPQENIKKSPNLPKVPVSPFYHLPSASAPAFVRKDEISKAGSSRGRCDESQRKEYRRQTSKTMANSLKSLRNKKGLKTVDYLPFVSQTALPSTSPEKAGPSKMKRTPLYLAESFKKLLLSPKFPRKLWAKENH